MTTDGTDSTDEKNEAIWIANGTYADRRVVYYHYASFFCTMAMFQMGGHYWEAFYPHVALELVANQRGDGSWRAIREEATWGDAFATATAVLALATPNQLIPVYQR